jgi:hypothetical protein
MRQIYPEGIDKTSGCTSTRVVRRKSKVDEHVNYDVVFDKDTGKFVSSADIDTRPLIEARKRTQSSKEIITG